MPDVTRLEVLERRLASDPDRFLRLETLRVRNHYADGTASPEYRCDYVVAPGVDAVAVVLFHREGDAVQVGLTECVRPPVTMRRDIDLIQPDGREYLTVTETVAGRLEPGDEGEEGISRRAAAEAHEEAGFAVEAADAIVLGGPLFSSPGQTPEKVHFRAFEVDPAHQDDALGDGSPMEAAHELRWVEVGEAIAQCMAGIIEDPKAEIGFRRLVDHLRGEAPAPNR